jgi:tRNA1Val (adenine37-N6)-methyltransferase
LQIIQPLRGYRFSIDSVLLARFAAAGRANRVLELGAGCGVVALLLAAMGKPRDVVAIERQPEMADMAARNASLNGLRMVKAICADLRRPGITGIAPDSFDLVVANPPYRRPNSGRESPDSARRAARAEGDTGLPDFIAAAARFARTGGRAAFVFDAGRTADLLSGLRAAKMEPKRLRAIHSHEGRRASAILVEARKGGGAGLVLEPPLVLFDSKGVYTAETRRLLSASGLVLAATHGSVAVRGR